MPARNKLPRSLSLKQRVEIDAVFNNGQRFSGRYCALLWLPADEFRYGVFVSRKHGGAVARNRIKRLFREALRRHRHELTQRGKLVILPKVQEVLPDWEQVEHDVTHILQKIESGR